MVAPVTQAWRTFGISKDATSTVDKVQLKSYLFHHDILTGYRVTKWEKVLEHPVLDIVSVL